MSANNITGGKIRLFPSNSLSFFIGNEPKLSFVCKIGTNLHTEHFVVLVRWR